MSLHIFEKIFGLKVICLQSVLYYENVGNHLNNTRII